MTPAGAAAEDLPRARPHSGRFRQASLITEPMTVATDTALAIVCGSAACDLARREFGRLQRESGQSSPRAAVNPRAPALWAASLGFAAAAAAAGAIAHGAAGVAPSTAASMWRTAIRCTGLSGAFFAGGGACAGLRGGQRWAALGLVATVQTVVQRRMGAQPSFRTAAIASGIDLSAGVACLANPARRGNRAALLACASAAVAGAGGLIQFVGWGRGRRFNHNDRFHIVQIGASALLYAAALSSSTRETATHHNGPVTPKASPPSHA